ncbi:MAG: hypothetical protein AB1529_00560 [Candidatus Micrarchaeota archaeon]
MSFLVETTAKTASLTVPEDITLITNLFFFLLLAIPAIAIILAVFIWKQSKIARALTTIFIIIVLFLAFVLLFIRFPQLPLPMFIPALLGAIILYYLWFDKKTLE